MAIPFLRTVFFSVVTCQVSKITAYDDVKDSGQHYIEERMLRTRLGSSLGSVTSLTSVLNTSQNSVPVRLAPVPGLRPSKPALIPRPKPTKPAQLPKRTPIAVVPIIPRPSTPKIPVTTVSAPKAPRTLPVLPAPALAGIAPRPSPVMAVPVSHPVPRPVTEASPPFSISLAPVSIINPPEGTNVTVPSTMYCGVKFSNGSFVCYSVGVPCTSRSNCTGLVYGSIIYNQCLTECGASP